MPKMKQTKDTEISAQVVLKPPYVASWQQVAECFRQAGFTIGPMVAGNFSITAPGATFARVFKVTLKVSARGTVALNTAERPAKYELPLTSLPETLRDEVQAVLFTRPPDFGPGAF